MAKNGRNWGWKLCSAGLLAMGGAITSFGNCALAQITPDGTLPNNSIVTPSGNTSRIAGGTQAGSNLFHSFDEFSVPTGSAAYFNNALDIQNIISRVTGGSVSNIDGLIKANGTANLFLLNPNGMMFGPNARLNIGGSFVASTASGLNFADGTQFSAAAPQTTPLLTVSVPIGLQYGGTAGSILNQSQATNSSGDVVGLQVQPGESLALIGGDVRLEGGELQALDGDVELGGLASPGSIGLSMNGSRMSLSFPDDVDRADVYLTNRGSNNASVNVAGSNGGSIAITARNIDISSSGIVLRGGIETNLGFPGAQAGDIELSAQGAINVTDGYIFSRVERGAMGKGGNIDITAGSLSVKDGAQLSSSTYGQGDAGSVNINARDTVSFDGVSSDGYNSAAFSSVEIKEAVGNGGGINITTGSLVLTNGALLDASSRGQGDGGNVNINARNMVSFDGVGSNGSSSAAASIIGSRFVGNGGDINITTGSLSLTNGAELLTLTYGQGNAGSVNINARNMVSFDGVGSNGANTGVFSNVERGAVGNGGDINITTGSLSLTNGAELAADTGGQGNAGSVTITARKTVSFNGVGSNGFPSGAFSSVGFGAVGNGGEINVTNESLSVTNGAVLVASTGGQGNGGNFTVNANTLEVVNGGQVRTTTRSSGKAGNVTLNVTDSITLSGSDLTYNARLAQFGEDVVSDAGPASGLFANTFETSTGQGGDLKIATGQLIVQDGAQVTASSQGTGDAGDILNISVRSLKLDNGSITTTSRSGQGGNIDRLQVQDLLLLRNHSQISTTAGINQNGGGNGGNITINTPFIVAVPSENSDIIANAYKGNGGNIQITTQGIFGIQRQERDTLQSDITASSQFGINGVVNIKTPDIDPSQGLAALPAGLVEASGLIATGCASVGESEFIVTGRGGLPDNPSDTLSSDAVQVDLVTLNPREENRSSPTVSTQPTSLTPTPIVEAQGWVIGENGEVILTANAPTVTPHNSWQTPSNCGAPKSDLGH